MHGSHVLIGLSSAGVVLAGLVGELITDANAVGKLGLCAFMGLCIIVLAGSIVALCRFIANTLIPLKEALLKLSVTADTSTKVLVEVKDAVKECNASRKS